MKRMITILATVSLLLTSGRICFLFSTSAETVIVSSEDPSYQYIVQEDGTIDLSSKWDETAEHDAAVIDGVAVIPSTLDGYTVTKISYLHSTKLRILILPDTVKEIGPRALQQCTRLEMLFLPEGLETISYNITYSDYLTEVVIPSTVVSIDRHAFGEGSITETSRTFAPGEWAAVDGFTYYSYNNPDAIAVAEEMGVSHIDLGTLEKGDCNRDGNTNVRDALFIYQVASGRSFGNPVGNHIGDMNDDKQTTMRDVMILYHQILGSSNV